MQNDAQPPLDRGIQSAFSFPRSHRLSGTLAFAAVFDAKLKKTKGPLVVYRLPNGLDHSRLGISIPRRVGTAPQRNRIKRLLRDAFRMHPFDSQFACDLVIVVRPHQAMPLADYQRILAALFAFSTPPRPAEKI